MIVSEYGISITVSQKSHTYEYKTLSLKWCLSYFSTPITYLTILLFNSDVHSIREGNDYFYNIYFSTNMYSY